MESIAIISAYLLDLIMGDPRWLPHPVKGMGKLVTFLEKKLRNGQKKYILRIKGIILSVIVIGGSSFIAWLLLDYSEKINPLFGGAVWILLGYFSLALKDLFSHAKAILKELKDRNIEEARQKLSLIVGRDTGGLSEGEIITATIESIAENTCDGVIAPLFYLLLGGPVLTIAYKAINTLDSMVGYKSEKYKDFGWFSARLDDVANFIPARITGILISISAFIIGKGFISSFKTMLQDGRKHPSPNSGISEAAMAGALGVCLGGSSTYQGRIIPRPYLGKNRVVKSPLLINKALKIGLITSLLMVVTGAVLKWVL